MNKIIIVVIGRWECTHSAQHGSLDDSRIYRFTRTHAHTHKVQGRRPHRLMSRTCQIYEYCKIISAKHERTIFRFSLPILFLCSPFILCIFRTHTQRGRMGDPSEVIVGESIYAHTNCQINIVGAQPHTHGLTKWVMECCRIE